MRRMAYNRIISLVLALALCLQLLPATLGYAVETDEPQETVTTETVPATTGETVPEATGETVSEATGETVSEATGETVPEATGETVPETTGETVPETTGETVPATTGETVPETTGETVPETTGETVPEATEETVPETAEDGPDPWEIIAACGGLRKPYAFGPGITYELPETLNAEDGAEAYAEEGNGNTISSMELLKQLLNNYHKSEEPISWSEDGNSLTSMPLDAGEQLILLSVTDSEVYQRTNFTTGKATGLISLAGEVENGDIVLTFQGLGSAAFPFEGSFANSSFTVKRTLFNALDYSVASFSGDSLTIDWAEPDTSKGAIVATKIIGSGNRTLTINIGSSLNKPYFRDAAFGEISGEIDLIISYSNNIAFENKSSNHNAGLVANTVSDGTLSLTIGSFPKEIKIGIDVSGDTKSNAGLLVGYLNNASLTLNNPMTPPTATIQAPRGGAGGIVGRVDHSTVSQITLNDHIDLTNVTILGNYTGGIAGYAQNVAFTFGESKTVALPGSLGVKANNIVGTGDVSSQFTGGIFGWYGCGNASAYSSFDGNGFSFPSGDSAPINLHVNRADGEAGTLFGHLVLGEECSFSVVGTQDSPLDISSKIVVADTTVGSVGGLVGKLEGNSIGDELIVRDNVTVSIPDVTKDKIKYLGGLVGSVENASVSVTGVSVMVPKPSATTYFGGLVASLGENCVLKTGETITVSTTGDSGTITKGGGLVGEAKSASVVRLSGITDLSDVAYTAGASVGQLVAKQDNALIFASGSGNGDGWTYQRSTAQARVDDIGNYGQVIRLGGKLSSNLISVGEGNRVCFQKETDAEGNEKTYGTIASADDFALHAIAFSTKDIFGLYLPSPSDSLWKQSITLTSDIDLSGTGIQGLMLDKYVSGDPFFAGNLIKNGITFDGGGKTITINTGEGYGLRNGVPVTSADIGSGQCYRHGNYGLLGAANSVKVINLTISSTMNIGADVATSVGFVIGTITGGNKKTTIENLIQNVTVTADSSINIDGSDSKISVSAGGLIGSVSGGETDIGMVNSNMHASMAYTNASANQTVMQGGVIGKDTYQNSFNLRLEGVTVTGSITSTATDNAHVGGLVADINANNAGNRNNNGATMSLKNVVIASTIQSDAQTTSGGFLGYFWDNVDVTFDGSGENPYAITTFSGDQQASLTASGAAAGGLCFAATGRWNMQDKAVDMGGASISNGSGALGLLVCHGERQADKPGQYSTGNYAKALYLVMNTEWATAYQNEGVNVFGTPAVFDEIVAYTARSYTHNNNPVYDITLNDAGIISLRTSGNTVNMTSGARNTYENRTSYGKNNQTNPYSRYYYNLDTLTAEGNTINTSEELLLWSVRKYGAANIQNYLTDLTSNAISSNTITGTLDMDGYSYYPVTVANTNVTVQDATITFYNKEIEALETGNKSTLASSSENRTQHFTMHSGLLHHYYTDSSATKTATLTVNNLTLLGTIGMVGSDSGALISGKIYGYNGTNPVKLELDTLKVDDEQKHLSVAGFNTDYAPLLINSVGSFATLNIAEVTAAETEAGATSLIGNVGNASDENTQGINLSFSKMKLPDKEGRFTKATMLHSLYFITQNNSAVYNFTKDEDWDSDNQHIYNVTYGREIGGTAEYADSGSNPHQYCYAQSQTNVSHSGTKFEGEERDSFEDYLPYVATKYDSQKGYHEIQVNSSLENIKIGCGTYGDPYRISTVEELQSIAIYLATGSASKDWTLNIPAHEADGSSAFCSGYEENTTHKIFVYNGSTWDAVPTAESPADLTEGDEEASVEAAVVPDNLSNETVQAYLRNAYYQITKDIEVTNFPGFGTRAAPFRGVIVGATVTGTEIDTKTATITLKGKIPKGFIVCSYGSVVKNLKLMVEGTTEVSFTTIQDNQGYTSESYFGGVIGCILGGDNIIDGVNVSYTGNNVTLGDTKPYLIPVGGYVGVISGGGVIFRGNNSLTANPSDKVTDENYFYANAYVGRVIQGFAVQEGGTSLDNSDKNYQICQLDSTQTGISVSEKTFTLNDAQALLVFSSVTNSGGAGGGQLLSYFANARTWWNGTTFGATSVGGKVRNASYNGVGRTTVNDDDYLLSLQDDYVAVSAENASYLDTYYAGRKLYNICGTDDYHIELKVDTIYDMTPYGNGYRSISPRYLANAVCGSTAGVNYQRLNPLLSAFNGKDARIQTKITVKEYVDDDHHAVAVGGVFNTLRFTNNAEMKNVTIGGMNNDSKGTISHEYYEWTGKTCADATHKNWGRTTVGFTNLSYEQGRGLIAIGGFAGNNVMDGDKNITFEKVKTENLTIKGPFDAGGVIGHMGLNVTNSQATSTNKNYHICYLIGMTASKIQPTFHNCRYRNLTIHGGLMVGGYLGLVTSGLYAPPADKTDIKGEIKITFDETDGVLGENSHIICERPKTDAGIDSAKQIGTTDSVQRCLPATGGLIGCSSWTVTIDNPTTAKIQNVEVRSSRSAGGVIAWPFSNVTIKNLSVIGSEENPNQIGDLLEYGTKNYDNNKVCEMSGGLVGYFETKNYSLVVENCSVENLLIVASLRTGYPCYSGGIVGNIYGSGAHVIANCKVKNLKLANDTCSDTTKQYSYDGGFVGRLLAGSLSGVNLLADSINCVKNSSKDQNGNLLGGSADRTIYLAGVSIQNTKNLNTVLQTDIGGTKPTKCYVAYADYNGAAQGEVPSPEGSAEGMESTQTETEQEATTAEATSVTENTNADKTGSVVPVSAAPYVTTSPRGVELTIYADGEQSTMFLYGDGADPNIVTQIFNERANDDKKKFYYSNVKDTANKVFSFDTKYSSTFYAEMGLTEETANGIPNFPVLQVPVADSKTVSDQIVDYLNLVTNNGYSTARTTTVGASEHITSSIDLYRWNDSGYFEKNPKNVTKAFSGSGQNFETSFSDYDSGKNQFELLTVTFTEASYAYRILVPIVVRRMLEVDFTATLKDSPSFKESDYEVYNADGFKSNITVPYGVSVSALMTYTYNRAIGEAQTFGWQTHLDSGSFMGDPEQTIQFYNPNSKLKSLPKGTQLILLDCANNNKAYRYEVGKQSESEGTKAKLSDFVDTDGTAYDSKWLSEIMGVTAGQSDNGKWVLLENSTGATARVKTETGYQYFRSKTQSDTDTTKLYNLTAATDDFGKEIQPEEQFYLVIYIPDTSVEGIPETSETEGKNLNGYISTTLPGLEEEIACNINSVRVKQDKTVVTDPQSSSESTYNFLSGYVQSLSDQSKDKENKLPEDPEAYILLNQPEADGNYLLHMDLVDEITVVKGQKDTEETPLYFKADISLPNYAKGENDTVSLVTANGFPTGCYGTAEFYVYLDDQGNKTYYTWNGSTWIPTTSGEKALFYEWTSYGGNMELYLGTANTEDGAVSLAQIRKLAKERNQKFYVETKMAIHMSVPAAEQVIAGAITKENAYTKLSYTTYLASSTDGFANTNYVESRQGEVRYYQSRSGSSTLTHSANDPTQLGINCSDLASANGVIYTTGVYDLTTLSNAEKLIEDADRVTYTLTLYQRQDSGEYAQVMRNLDDYIRSVRMHDNVIPLSEEGSVWGWTDEKSNNTFASTDPENGKRFLLPIRIQVNTDVETNGVTFANYQLRLTAKLCKDEEELDHPVNGEITVAGKTEEIRDDYVTYTITRLLTSGYWGENISG